MPFTAYTQQNVLNKMMVYRNRDKWGIITAHFSYSVSYNSVLVVII